MPSKKRRQPTRINPAPNPGAIRSSPRSMADSATARHREHETSKRTGATFKQVPATHGKLVLRNGEAVLRMNPLSAAGIFRYRYAPRVWKVMELHMIVDNKSRPGRKMIDTLRWLMSPKVRRELRKQGTVAYIGFSKNKALIDHVKKKYDAQASPFLPSRKEKTAITELFALRMTPRREKYAANPVHMIVIQFPDLNIVEKRIFRMMVSNRYRKVLSA